MSAAPPAPPPAPEPASLFKRFAAFCYDLLLLCGVVFFFTLAVLGLRGGRAIPPGTVWFELALAAVAMLFFGWFWTHGGQTLGMRAWRIRVIRADGGALRWTQAALRFWAAVLALLPLGLGLWWGAFDAQRRGWHDRWTGTRVVRVPSRPR
ncbi:MAG TPA: RDD family protein [Gammaproteobacteria bacterium]|nr:RDD family protein [Gammaproteobacteria bacterium]